MASQFLIIFAIIIFFVFMYLIHRQSSQMSLFLIVILYIIVFLAVMVPIMMFMVGTLSGPSTFFMVLFLVALVGIPAHFVMTIVGRRKKRKAATYITLEDDYVTGIGEIVYEGSGFGGVSVGSGGVRPMIGGVPSKAKLRGFKIPYSKIISVDLLVNESGIVLMTQTANYNCYIDNAQAVQDAIVKRME